MTDTLKWTRHVPISLSLVYMLLTLSNLVVPAALAQSEVQFSFNPRDGTTFVENVRSTKTVTVWEQGVPQNQSMADERKSRYVIRKTDTGYVVQVTPLLPPTKVSADAALLMRELLSSADLTYELDNQGRLMQVMGMNKAFETFKKALPPNSVNELLAALGQTGKSADQMAADQWNDRNLLGVFAGNSLVLGRTSSKLIKVPLPIGKSYPASLILKVTGSTLCASNPCVHILFSYSTDDPSIGETMADLLRNMVISAFQALAPGQVEDAISRLPRFEFADQKVMYEDSRNVDPTTGLPYGETETRTMQALVGMEGQAKTRLETKESLVYSYHYE